MSQMKTSRPPWTCTTKNNKDEEGEAVVAEEPAEPIEPDEAATPDEPIRRLQPARNRHAPQEWWRATVGMAHDSQSDKPATIQEALMSSAGEHWQQAMRGAAIASLQRNLGAGALPSGRRAVECPWLFKVKRQH
jgi:hypothetical protein